jgi:hypothetical protein
VAIPSIAGAWRLVRQLEDLLSLQTEVRQSLQAVNQRLGTLEERMLRLESGQTQLITEARSAATTAATMIAGAVIADAVTRITRLEGRAEQLEQQRLPPP